YKPCWKGGCPMDDTSEAGQKSKKSRRGRRFFRFLLLAILCIGGTELAVCRYADPGLYARVTAPARQAVQRVSDAVSHGVDAAVAAHQLRIAEREAKEAMETQQAGGVAIWSELVPASTVTALVEQDGICLLTGGTVDVPYYNQGESPWVDAPYGSDAIGGHGCGPTAMAMAVSALTDTAVTPTEMAAWSVKNGYWVARGGSRLALISGAAQAYGLEATALRTFTPEALLQALSGGGLVVALMTRGHFTQSGHFILLRGATLDGRILVADPNSTQRSLTTWEPQLILDELSPNRSDGAPLWVLSPAP
ncbi:MAG: C39 family peptidase, partial [Oscillospiraceae bacterium]